MRDRLSIKKDIGVLARYAGAGSEGSDTAADRLDAVRREGRALCENRAFLSFSGTRECGALLARLGQILRRGELPGQEELIGIFRVTGLTAGQTVFLRECVSLTLIRTAARAAEANDAALLRSALLSFFGLMSLDFAAVREQCCTVDRIYARERAGAYARMDRATKDRYVKTTYLAARKTGVTAESYAAQIRSRADLAGKHVGFFLPLLPKKKTLGVVLLLAGHVLAAAAAASVGVLSASPLAAFLTFLPLAGIFTETIPAVSASRTRPAFLPRMDPARLAAGRDRVAAVVSAVISPDADMQALERRLLSLWLSQRDCDVTVVLCCDLPPARNAHERADRETIERYTAMTDRLNKAGERFVFALRGRKYSISERMYIGRERKRGALLALTEYITEKKNEFLVLHGAYERLPGTPYLLLLDEDSVFPFGALRNAVAAAEHPLNRPALSADGRCVARGYGMFAFPCAPSVATVSAGIFPRDLCGFGGVSAYHGAFNDFYGDRFGDGIFCGKGLTDAAVYDRLLRGRFPAERVLSHDVVEGCVLQVKTLTDTVVTDAFPRTEEAYLRRAHRWIRGDVQDLIFAFGRRRLKKDGKTDFLSAYKLADNVKRALLPVAGAVGVLLSLLLPEGTCAAVTAVCLLGASFADLRSFFTELFAGGVYALTGRTHAEAAPKALSALRRAVLSVSRLGIEALNASDAVVRSAYRMTVSKRKLLEWNTSASSGGASSFPQLLLRRLPVLAAAAALIASLRPLAAAVGALWIFDLFYAHLSQRPLRQDRVVLSPAGRAYLREQTAKIARFFEDSHKRRYHYLPPDNVSFAPIPRVAERTSPTNIGLCLCAFLAARDLGTISSRRLFELLDETLSSVERLETSHGNLLNWYDITTGRAMEPAFVSFVDSGNCLCCLIALKEGLRAYFTEDARLFDLSVRIEKLISACDLSVFYDPVRDLFRTGYDARTGKPADAWYDLRISEARMSGFAAVALGQAPVRHLGAPVRAGGRCGGTEGLLSWSGTMFEYFMPYLFLPVRKNTLDDESLWFAYQAQRRAGRKRGAPWGVSESCFFAFDEGMEYSYKAHGVRTCALQSSAGEENVIAPYATFLTLPYVGDRAVENLKRLERYGAVGRYGFFEAVDLTPGRCSDGRPSVVRCFMSHHLGMSLLAAENALNGAVWQRRFTARAQIMAAADLLDEQVCRGLRLPKREKHRRERAHSHIARPAGTLPAALYAGGALSAAAHTSGCMALYHAGRSLFFPGRNVLREPFGIFAAVWCEGKVSPFTQAPLYHESAEGGAETGRHEAVWRSADELFALTQSLSVSAERPAAFLRFKIRNRSRQKRSLSFCVYADPCLAPPREEQAHRAFSKLFIRSRVDRERGAMVFERGSLNGGYALVVGLEAPCAYTADRCEVYDVEPFDRLPQPKGTVGSVDCCFCARTDLILGARRETQLILTVCAGETAAQALGHYDAARKERGAAACRSFREDAPKAALLSAMLCDILFRKESPSAPAVSPRQTELWEVGVSGDRPIAALDLRSDTRSLLPALADVSRAMAQCGIENELAVVYRETDGYGASVRRSVEHALRGVPFARAVDSAAHPASARAVFSLCDAAFPRPAEKNAAAPVELRSVAADPIGGMTSRPYGDGFYVVRKKWETPWSWCLANQSFGTLFTDRSLGYTWAIDSAEGRLTPWFGQPDATMRGELLTLRSGEVYYDLLDGAAAVFRETGAAWYCRAAGLSVCIEVAVPEVGMRKLLTVRVRNQGRGRFIGELAYTVFPTAGSDLRSGRAAVKEDHRGGVLFDDAYTQTDRGYLFLYSPSGVCADAPRFRCSAGVSCGASVRVPLDLAAGESKEAAFALSFALKKEAAAALAFAPFPPQQPTAGVTLREGSEEIRTLAKRFLVWQVKRVRLFARCGPRQCSGAYGFRDQLQDCMALATIEPALLKIRLLQSASVQFPEGDVLHWYHIDVENGRQAVRGVRTHCSDDLLWLPLAAAEYVRATGDAAVMDTLLPFLAPVPLAAGERDRYARCARSDRTATLREHCRRALERADRRGAHGLLLIGGGDWNDSFGEVGVQGRGESVWLTQFYALTAKRAAPLFDNAYGGALLSRAEELLANVDRSAWFGDRYARAFYDDGAPMGVPGSGNSEIDLLPQSFAVLAGMPDEKRVRTALDTAYELLYDRQNRLVRLFTPPFDETKKPTGYVCHYPPGVRENGGQYTHAAVWFALALHRAGETGKAREIMEAICPMSRLEADGGTGRYRNEPYALSADVYSLEGYEGRGGWSLYTGAAGWYLRAATEIFGLE